MSFENSCYFRTNSALIWNSNKWYKKGEGLDKQKCTLGTFYFIFFKGTQHWITEVQMWILKIRLQFQTQVSLDKQSHHAAD